MKKFFLLIGVSSFLFADWDQSCIGEDDPTIVHNVNVITGNLNLFFPEAVVKGAVSFPVRITYSSRGALDARNDQSIKLKRLRSCLEFDGGWSIFPHLSLLVDFSSKMAYALEPTGSLIHFNSDGQPATTIYQCGGQFSGRKNPSNHRLRLDTKNGEAVIFLANGGWRRYQGAKEGFFSFLDSDGHRYYMLIEERMSSGHRIFYKYYKDPKTGQNTISIKRTSPQAERNSSYS